MLLQFFLALIFGIIAGTITGLIPGIHINLIGIFLITIPTSTNPIKSIYFVVFIVAMAITHTFVDFIPSVFLGCPDTDTELSVLPGHELLKKGLGYEAVLLTCYGGLASVLILLIISLPSIIIIPKIYLLTKKAVPYILILVSILLISLEKKKLNALLAFSLSGVLGLCVLNLNGINQPLLPLLTGLFGSSTLILSIKNKTKIPEQKIAKVKANLFKPMLGAIIASPLCSFLPGLGSGQAAIIGNTISNRKQKNNKNFLILLGATNTLVMSFSFISLYTISKTRTGAAFAIKQLIKKPTPETLVIILTTVAASGIIAFLLTILLAKLFSQKITKINYTLVSIATIIILSIIIIAISKFIGLFILIISTFTGIYCISLGVRRTNMMGCLIIPTIILYLL